jgi:hypothetical protein
VRIRRPSANTNATTATGAGASLTDPPTRDGESVG